MAEGFGISCEVGEERCFISTALSAVRKCDECLSSSKVLFLLVGFHPPLLQRSWKLRIFASTLESEAKPETHHHCLSKPPSHNSHPRGQRCSDLAQLSAEKLDLSGECGELRGMLAVEAHDERRRLVRRTLWTPARCDTQSEARAA